MANNFVNHTRRAQPLVSEAPVVAIYVGRKPQQPQDVLGALYVFGRDFAPVGLFGMGHDQKPLAF